MSDNLFPKVKITLNDTLNKRRLSRNAVAVEGKIRPATISELCNDKSKAISFDTLQRIILALNALTGEEHSVDDVIIIDYT